MIIRWKRKNCKEWSCLSHCLQQCSHVNKIKHQKSEDYIKASQYIRNWAEHERVLSSFKHDARKGKNNTSKQIIALARCTDLFYPVTTLTFLLKLCDVISSNDLKNLKRSFTYFLSVCYTTNYLLWRVIVLLRSRSCRQFQPPVIVHHCVGRFAKVPWGGEHWETDHQQAYSDGTRKFRKEEAVRLSR